MLSLVRRYRWRGNNRSIFLPLQQTKVSGLLVLLQQERRQLNSANSNVDLLQYSHNQRSFPDLSEIALLIARRINNRTPAVRRRDLVPELINPRINNSGCIRSRGANATILAAYSDGFIILLDNRNNRSGDLTIWQC
jgi:hypothetical protein